MTASTDRRPGLKVWAWERSLQVAFSGTLAAFAAAILGVAFTLKSSGRVIAFIIVGILVAATFIFLIAAANKPVSDEKEKKEKHPSMVDKSKSFATDPESAASKPIKPPRGPR